MRFVSSLVLVTGLVACSATSDRDGAGGFGPSGGDAGDESGTGFLPDGGPGGLDDVNPEASIDPEKDNDGDGWLFKDDCDDTNVEVNPGAFDVRGDGVDNDCNGKVDDVDDCDTALLTYDSKDPLDFARALGLCKVASADATGKDKRWGVVKAELVHADGSSGVDPLQYGILKKFGPNVDPRAGKNFVVLSSGAARTPDYPGFVAPLDPSHETPSEVAPPAGWPKNSAGCPDPDSTSANDSVNLKLTIRVPTNARGFAYDFNFYSSEYITWVCSSFNDSFVALLDTTAPMDPKFGKNVSFDALGNPINVNSGFFEVCTPGTSDPIFGGTPKSFACAKGTSELQGSGYWDPDLPSEHGATSWLETKAPVVPGETITLQFMIWDTEDHVLDSSVLLDNFRWDAKGTTAPVTDRPK